MTKKSQKTFEFIDIFDMKTDMRGSENVNFNFRFVCQRCKKGTNDVYVKWSKKYGTRNVCEKCYKNVRRNVVTKE